MDAAPSSLPSSSSLAIASPFLDLSSLEITSYTSQSFLQPFPPLLNELKEEILRFCDPSTLAKTSLVSLAFLEMSSPLLYDEVEIVGFENMARLFCPRDPFLHQAHLEPFLSLHRMRSCTLIAGPSDARKGTRVFIFSQDRVPSPLILVDKLDVRLRWMEYEHIPSVYKGAWVNLLSFFNPICLTLHTTVLPVVYEDAAISPLPLNTCRPWPRLRRLEILDETRVRLPPMGEGFLTSTNSRVEVGGELSDGRLTIVLECWVERDDTWIDGFSFYPNEDVFERLWRGDRFLDCAPVREFVVIAWVYDEEITEDVLMEFFRQSWREDGVDEDVMSRRNRRLKIEVRRCEVDV